MPTKDDHPCRCKDLMQETDDDDTLNLIRDVIAPALTPSKFVVTIEVAACAPYNTVKTLVDQYRSIKNVPATAPVQEELLSELRDIASTTENLPTLIAQDIEKMFLCDEPFTPDLSDAKCLGIEMEWSWTVTDE